jgi:hypothetical protein
MSPFIDVGEQRSLFIHMYNGKIRLGKSSQVCGDYIVFLCILKNTEAEDCFILVFYML